jgi:hypothetical protein
MDSLLTSEFLQDYNEFKDSWDLSPIYECDPYSRIYCLAEYFKNFCTKYFNNLLLRELKKLDKDNIEKYKLDNHHILSTLFQDIEDFDDLIIHIRYNLHSDDFNIFDNFTKIYHILIKEKENDKKKPMQDCAYKDIMLYDKDRDIRYCKNLDDSFKWTWDPKWIDVFNIEYNESNLIYSLLNKITTKLPIGSKIRIILGSVIDLSDNESYDINIYFNKPLGYPFEKTYLEKMKRIEQILDDLDHNLTLEKNYYIFAYFPLNTHPTHLPLLNLIIDLHDNYDVYLVSKMNGFIYGSFYYLSEELSHKKGKTLNFTKGTNYLDKKP